MVFYEVGFDPPSLTGFYGEAHRSLYALQMRWIIVV
jgi:hypothetical protein